MNKPIESPLKILFVIQALSSFLTGALGVFLPATIIGLSGLDLAATPAIQQAGALSLGYTLGALMALRAASWAEVRIFAYASLVAFALSLIGAAYYIFIVSVVATGLVVILAASLIMTVGLAYYVWKYMKG
jgi:hypothetical protein